MIRAFKKQDEAHNVATVALGDALYDRTHGEAEKVARKLPQGWVDYSAEIVIDAAGFWRPDSGIAGRKSNVLRLTKARPFPHFGASKAIKVYAGHPLNDQAQLLAAEWAAIRDAKAELRAQLKGVVYSVTTLAKLLAAWPECAEILPASAPKPSRAVVPVDLVAGLNKRLNLRG